MSRPTWPGLPKETRAEVKRLAMAGRAHPDPEVAEIAYRWAQRARLRSASLRTAYLALASAPLVLATTDVGWLYWPITGVWLSSQLAWLTVPRLTSLEAASVRAGAFAVRRDAAPDSLVIHRSRREAWLTLATTVFILGLSAGALRKLGTPGLVEAAALCLLAGYVAMLGHLSVPSRQRPLAVLDRDGMQVPHLGVAVPWSAFSTADASPDDPVLRWRLREPGTLRRLSTLPRWRQWMLRRGGDLDDAITLHLDWLDVRPEVVLSTSWSLAERARS